MSGQGLPTLVYRDVLASVFIARISAEVSWRLLIASAAYLPCLNAFSLPFGAPGDVPPCIRHRPFFIAIFISLAQFFHSPPQLRSADGDPFHEPNRVGANLIGCITGKSAGLAPWSISCRGRRAPVTI
jgi:hypothetical protein